MTMAAAWYSRQGPARDVIKLGEQPLPKPGAGELLIRVHSSAVNPSDCNRRAGHGHRMDYPLIIPNSDGSGEVVEIGPDADPYWLDRKVWFYNGQRGRAFGSAAQYIAIDQALVSDLPDSVTFEEGATLGIPCMTAYVCLVDEIHESFDGVDILVTGGAGAVGHYAIQLATSMGARVVATVSNPSKANEAKIAGAQHTVEYGEKNWADAVLQATNGRGISRVIDVDFGKNLDQVLRVCDTNAVIVTYASRGNPLPVIPVYELMRKNITLRTVYLPSVTAKRRKIAQEAIGSWLGAKRRIHRLVPVQGLDKVVLAHELVESGRKEGTVVVNLHTPGDC